MNLRIPCGPKLSCTSLRKIWRKLCTMIYSCVWNLINTVVNSKNVKIRIFGHTKNSLKMGVVTDTNTDND